MTTRKLIGTSVFTLVSVIMWLAIFYGIADALTR